MVYTAITGVVFICMKNLSPSTFVNSNDIIAIMVYPALECVRKAVDGDQ